jgi:hypothetical protein
MGQSKCFCLEKTAGTLTERPKGTIIPQVPGFEQQPLKTP